MKQLSQSAWNDLAKRALENGAIRVGHAVLWRLATRCDDPTSVDFQYTRDVRDGVLTMFVPCRRCPRCLKRRAALWAARAKVEAFGRKTWFGTLTYGPSDRRRLLAGAAGKSGPALTQSLVQTSGQDLQRYLKRVRKAGYRLRYLSVPELHRDGFVHWHLLIHGDVNWRMLNGTWTHGFSRFELAKDAGAIRYVTKYLSKDRLGRIRASRSYGSRAHPVTKCAPGTLYNQTLDVLLDTGLSGADAKEISFWLTWKGYTLG